MLEGTKHLEEKHSSSSLLWATFQFFYGFQPEGGPRAGELERNYSFYQVKEPEYFIKILNFLSEKPPLLKKRTKTFLAVQWLRLPSSARCAGSIPHQRAKIPQALWPKNKQKKSMKWKQYYKKFNKDFKSGPH